VRSFDNDTLAGALRDRIRDDVLSARLRPGQRLRFAELGTRYQVKPGVAREALAGLVSLGLVSASPHRGYTVASVTHEGLQQLIEARQVVEPLLLAHSIRSGDAEWEARVIALHHLLERATEPDGATDSNEWASAHAAFHAALLSGSDNARLREFARAIDNEATLYRRWSAADADFRRREADEHRRLRDHAVAHAVDAAVVVMREHIVHQREAGLAPLPTEAKR